MSVRIRVSLITAAAVSAVLLLSGCGPDTALPGFVPPSTSSQPALPGGSGGGGSGASAGGGGGGFALNSDCLGVLSAYSSIALALLPALTGSGNGTYDAGQVATAIAGLGGKVPDQLKGDFETLSTAAKQAAGKTLAEAGQILGSPAVSAATDDISKWTDANCG